MKKLLVTFSGGKTSAYMTYLILENLSSDYNIVVVFANTGQENNETLDFVNMCDIHLNFGTVWVEAAVHPGRNATTHIVTSYKDADRDGRVFESVIKKYGIPNMAYPHCTRELKERAIHSFIKSIGWKRGEYNTAIGIRTDETRRVRKTKDYQNIIYPLVDSFPSDKTDVNDFWEDQAFSLTLAEHQGNCKWCWKKSIKKHLMLIKENPEIFEFPMKMEKIHGFSGHNDGVRKRVFFRSNRNTDDLFKLAGELEVNAKPGFFDENSGCSESCELFEMDD